MGKQGDIKLRGTMENIIYYQWKGIHCMRTVPEKVRQTKPTKKAASDFGLAVKSAAVVRAALRPLMPQVPADRSIIYSTDNAFRKWLQTNPLNDDNEADGILFFDWVSFNEEVNFKTIVQPKITIARGSEGSLLINWPECNPVNFLRAPNLTVQAVVRYVAVTIGMTGKNEPHCSEAQLAIPYIDQVLPATEILLENVTATKCLALLGMSVSYYKDELQCKPVNMMRWKPAGIVTGFYN
jgi:hypothetical protein